MNNKFTVYEKIDYYNKLYNRTKDKNKKDIYWKRIKELQNSKEWTLNGELGHRSKKRTAYLKKTGWKADPNWTGD